MIDAMERWLHEDNQPKPSYCDVCEWLAQRHDELVYSATHDGEQELRNTLDVIYRGLMLFDAAKHGDADMVETIWRLDISVDGGETWEEVCRWSESDYPINAERLATTRAGAARLDGYASRVVKLTRHFVEQSEEVPQ